MNCAPSKLRKFALCVAILATAAAVQADPPTDQTKEIPDLIRKLGSDK